MKFHLARNGLEPLLSSELRSLSVSCGIGTSLGHEAFLVIGLQGLTLLLEHGFHKYS